MGVPLWYRVAHDNRGTIVTNDGQGTIVARDDQVTVAAPLRLGCPCGQYADFRIGVVSVASAFKGCFHLRFVGSS